MQEKSLKKISKILSYWLRHNPEDIGLNVDPEGWVNVSELLEKSNSRLNLNTEKLKDIVQNNDKQRFAFNEDCTLIRASQGHSINVDLNLSEVKPPEFVYHGTRISNVDIILKEGIKKMNRTHVHLSKDEETAETVGSRRGECKILKIESLRMRDDGVKVFMSENGVYLTDYVDPKYISTLST